MKFTRWLTAIVLLLAAGSMVLAQDIEPTPDDEPDNTIEIDVDEVGEDAEELAEDAVNATETVAQTTLTALQDLADRIAVSPENTPLRVLFIVGGAILLLLGWRIYDEVIILAGILVGAAVGAGIVGDGGAVLEIAGLLVGGLIGALIAILLYYVAVFFIGAYVGLLFTYAAVQTLDIAASDVVLFVGALVGGILLVIMSAQLIIILSAIVGAQMIVLGLGLTTEWIVLLAIVGVVVQFIIIRSLRINLRERPRRNYRKIIFG